MESPLVLLAVAAILLAACDEGRMPSSGDEGRSTGPSSSNTQGSSDNDLQAKVDRIDAQVAAIRGLDFHRPVQASWVARTRIQAVQDSISAAMGYSTDTAGSGAFDEVLQALGYLERTTTHDAANSDFVDQNVLAFYADGTDHLWVVSDQADAQDLDRTIAHELVHALQDQNFGSPSTSIDELDEREAYKFLVEGEAEYVSNLWYMSDASIANWDARANSFSASTFAAWIVQSPYATQKPIMVWPGVSPYLCGTTFVHQVRKLSGWSGVDALHDKPARATTQALSVAAGGLRRTFLDWSTTWAFASMSDRRSDGSGRLGEIYLDALLSTWNAPILSDWNGDRFWIWGAGTGWGTAVAGRTAWNSSAAASNFLAGWTRGMRIMVGGVATGTSDSVEFRSSDALRFARGVRRGSEVLVVWGDLRNGKLDGLWQDLSRVPSAGTLARALDGTGGKVEVPRWKDPRAHSPFWR